MSTLLLVVMFLSLTHWASAAPTPYFENTPGQLTQSGYFKLQWAVSPDVQKTGAFTYEVQQSDNGSFEQPKNLYAGPDLATFCSGYKNGTYFFRVRAIASNENAPGLWSPTLTVRVKHHSIHLAFALFGLGALVFLLTVGIVVRGSRRVRAPKK